jgi:ankyrin repeat protein
LEPIPGQSIFSRGYAYELFHALAEKGNATEIRALVNTPILARYFTHAQYRLNAQMNVKTALELAAKKGFVDLFKFLITNDVMRNLNQNTFSTALMLAIKNNHESIINCFLKNEHTRNYLATSPPLFKNIMKMLVSEQNESASLLLLVQPVFGTPPLISTQDINQLFLITTRDLRATQVPIFLTHRCTRTLLTNRTLEQGLVDLARWDYIDNKAQLRDQMKKLILEKTGR